MLESHEGPWVGLGDFNFTLNENEKFGGKKGSSSAPNYLKELTFDFGAIDLGFSGNKYTWAKGKWGNAPIKRRLDRGIASISWGLAYPKASIALLRAIKSDHTPPLLNHSPIVLSSSKPSRLETIDAFLSLIKLGMKPHPALTLQSSIKSKLQPLMP